MKKICVLAACLVLVASLALPAFAANVDPAPDVVSYTGSQLDNDHYYPRSTSGYLVVTSLSAPSYSRIYVRLSDGNSLDYRVAGGTGDQPLSVGLQIPLSNISWFSLGSIQGSQTVSITVTLVRFSVSPSFDQPVTNGSYSVSSLTGVQNDAFMYATKEQPKTFVFSDVTANTGTKVSYAITAEGGSVTYHDIGTLEDGFTFASADYPVASYFTVRNTRSTPASYTVTVSDAAIDKSSGIALSIWETCLTMGTAAITWITTGTNFIALIPIAMMLLVFAVLCIRKLIKGV